MVCAKVRYRRKLQLLLPEIINESPYAPPYYQVYYIIRKLDQAKQEEYE